MEDSGTRPEIIAIAGGLLGLIGVPVFILGDLVGVYAIPPVGVALLIGAVFCFTIAAGKR